MKAGAGLIVIIGGWQSTIISGNRSWTRSRRCVTNILAPLRSSPQLIEIQNSLFDYRAWIRIVISPVIDRCFQRPFSSRNKNIKGELWGTGFSLKNIWLIMEDWLKRRRNKKRLISACFSLSLFRSIYKKKGKKEKERRWNENVWKNKVDS